MNKYRSPITAGSKIIIGLGDSFTQGVGSWSKETYDQHNGYIDPLRIPDIVKTEMYHNSWVAQICRNHLPEYTPVNLGMMGTGNRASVKELYLNPELRLDTAKEVIVIFLLSGMERFDFVNKEFPKFNHFYTMWPNPGDKNTTNKKLWEAYAESLWSDKFVTVETLINIKEAETFCKAHGYKFVVASAFEQRITKDKFLKVLGLSHAVLIDTIPWDSFLYPNGYLSFIELLIHLDGHPQDVANRLAHGAFYEYYSKLKCPTKYITNCMHPTQEGHRIMAEVIYKFLQEKQYV